MRTTPFTVVYDACVLYPAPLRDLLMWLALSGLFRAKWSPEIHAEWQGALLRQRPDLNAEQLRQTAELMDRAVPDALIQDHQSLAAAVPLPDPDDRHVVAAAIHSHAQVIVTFNLKDFPASALKPLGIEAQHPDDFVEDLFYLAPAKVLGAVQKQRANLKSPPVDAGALLDRLASVGLPRCAKALGAFRAVL